MGTREDYRGAAAALTLDADLTAGDLTFAITGDTSGWPTGASGRPFSVVIDRGKASEEKLLCATLTPTAVSVSSRGYDGTSDENHTAGATIEHYGLSATKADDLDTHVYDPTRDDHVQYVPTDGTRGFSGVQQIVDLPVSIGGATNQPGTANTLARSDHIHAIAAQGISDPEMFVSQVIPPTALQDSTIGTTKLVADSITRPLMADAAIGTSELMDGAVRPAKTSVIPYCRVTSTFPTVFPNNTTTRFAAWDSQLADTDTMHSTSTNPERITCTTAGVYLAQAALRFSVPSGTLSFVKLEIRRNGTIEHRKELPVTSTSSTPVTIDVSGLVPCAAGEYLELWAMQVSAQNLTPTINANYSPVFSAVWVGNVV